MKKQNTNVGNVVQSMVFVESNYNDYYFSSKLHIIYKKQSSDRNLVIQNYKSR